MMRRQRFPSEPVEVETIPVEEFSLLLVEMTGLRIQGIENPGISGWVRVSSVAVVVGVVDEV